MLKIKQSAKLKNPPSIPFLSCRWAIAKIRVVPVALVMAALSAMPNVTAAEVETKRPNPYIPPTSGPSALQSDSADIAWFLANTASDRKPDMASLCSGIMTIVIKGPREQDDCNGFFDTLFYADLKTRRVYWSRQALQSIASGDHKEATIGVLRHQLQTYGKETLESMRRFELFDVDGSTVEGAWHE